MFENAHHFGNRLFRCGHPDKNKVQIIPVWFQLKGFPCVNTIGVFHDAAVFGLPEIATEGDGGEKVTLDQVPQHIARAHGRQLVFISDNNEECVRTQRTQQGVEKMNVRHGEFVNNHRVGEQRTALIMRELSGLGIDLQQPVYG